MESYWLLLSWPPIYSISLKDFELLRTTSRATYLIARSHILFILMFVYLYNLLPLVLSALYIVQHTQCIVWEVANIIRICVTPRRKRRRLVLLVVRNRQRGAVYSINVFH
jgi:predicted membrane protein